MLYIVHDNSGDRAVLSRFLATTYSNYAHTPQIPLGWVGEAVMLVGSRLVNWHRLLC